MMWIVEWYDERAKEWMVVVTTRRRSDAKAAFKLFHYCRPNMRVKLTKYVRADMNRGTCLGK